MHYSLDILTVKEKDGDNDNEWKRSLQPVSQRSTTKLDEIEELMKEVAEFYLEQDGVIDVHYIKRTHRQKDFNAVKEGELPIRLTRNVGKMLKNRDFIR